MPKSTETCSAGENINLCEAPLGLVSMHLVVTAVNILLNVNSFCNWLSETIMFLKRL